MMKDMSVLREQMRRIDTIKEQLMDICCILEEEGFDQKAKSLDTLIGKLEWWEHTGACRK
jgi:hypothetical protein